MRDDDPVLQTLLPATHDLGGFKVHRTLPHRDRTMVGPFVFFDQMGPAHLPAGEGIDVRPHPHIALSTVTYLFDGAIDHRDSLGTVQTIEAGAVNLMTAGTGIVHSERSPMLERAKGPPLSGIQTWLALPDGREEIDPAFEHVAADALPVFGDAGARATVIMGSLWGKTSPVTAYAPTIYADIVLEAGGAVPIDADADERALYLVDGAATIDGRPLEKLALMLLKPGIVATLRSAGGARVMLAGGGAFATPRHVWWNFVSSSRDRIRQAREDWKAGRFATVPGDPEYIPIPDVPKTGELSMTTRIALPTGVELDVAVAGDPAKPALLFLHGFPESHRTWRHQIAALSAEYVCIAPDQRGFARSSKPGAVADYRADRLVGDVIALADHFGIERFTLVAHDWGGAIGWAAALQHPSRVGRLVIANAPHPLIFQRSLIDDPAQRAASQYISVFRDPGFEDRIAEMGLETFLDRSFAPHVDAAKVTAEDRAAYLDDWREPGAMTAMLNWYRASQIVVSGIGEDAAPPAWTLAPFPVLDMPVLVIWGMRDVALLPVQLDGLDALVRDLTIARIDAGHFVPWDAPDAVTDAMRAWLARA